MEDRIAPLIAERAPWLEGPGLAAGWAKPVLHKLLQMPQTLELGERLADQPAPAIMEAMGQRLAQRVTLSGLGHIPRSSAALIIANHPTGIADAIMLHHALARLRDDIYYFANRDILRVFPQFATMIAPVEWRLEKRTHAKMRETMTFTRRAVADGRLGVIFPSGRLAKRRGFRLQERPWMASAAMIARLFDLPIIPVNIQARNSALFYLFDAIHPTLRDITLFYETLNKARQPFHITVGEPISPAALPRSSEDAIEVLRRETLQLGVRELSLMSPSLRPSGYAVRS